MAHETLSLAQITKKAAKSPARSANYAANGYQTAPAQLKIGDQDNGIISALSIVTLLHTEVFPLITHGLLCIVSLISAYLAVSWLAWEGMERFCMYRRILDPKITVCIVYVAAMFMSIMDSTVVNVALPALTLRAPRASSVRTIGPDNRTDSV